MTIISNLQNMPIQLAMKISDYIPNYFKLCSDTLARFDSEYQEAVESIDMFEQVQIESLNRSRKFYENAWNNAKTEADRKRYKDWIDETDAKIQIAKDDSDEMRSKQFRNHAAYATAIIGIAAAGIGASIEIGNI